MKTRCESKFDDFFPHKTENIWREYSLFIANSENQKKKRLQQQQQPNNEGNNKLI